MKHKTHRATFWSPERNRDLTEMVAVDEPIHKIAAALGVTQAAIRRQCDRLNIKPSKAVHEVAEQKSWNLPPDAFKNYRIAQEPMFREPPPPRFTVSGKVWE